MSAKRSARTAKPYIAPYGPGGAADRDSIARRIFASAVRLPKLLRLTLTDRPDDRRSEAKPVASSASGLLAAAAKPLPVADRARYAEEYRRELWELAQSGAGSLRQLRYALRQVLHTLPMSFALRSPRRKSAAP